MKVDKVLLFLILSLPLVVFILPFRANAETYNLNVAFSNYDPGDIGYDGSYGTIVLTDLGTDIFFSVKGTAPDGEDLGTDPDLQFFYFNTTTDVSGLTFSTQNPISPAGTLNYSFDTSSNFYKPDGDGYFDGVVDFGDGGTKLSSISFALSADNPLDISDFIAGSVGGNKGSFIFAAHWQNTDTPAESEFVGSPVPIPGAIWLLWSGLIGLVGVRNKFKK